MNGKPPEGFARKYISAMIDELKTAREKQQWLFSLIGSGTKPMTENDAAYLNIWRRLGTIPDVMPRVGFNPSVRLYHGKNYMETPAMIAALQDADGKITGWHVTHLTERGEKAHKDCRRYHKKASLNGSAIRLYPVSDSLAVCEGIETAVALHMITGTPVWACGDAGKLKEFIPPEGIKRLLIAGDNDKNGVGQAAAWSLYNKYKNKLACNVKIPDRENTDWLDSIRSEK